MLMRCDEDRVARCRDVRMCSHSTGSRALTACVYTCVYTLLCVSISVSMCLISVCVRRFSRTAAGSLGSRATAAPRQSPAPASSGTTQSPPRTRSGLTRSISLNILFHPCPGCVGARGGGAAVPVSAALDHLDRDSRRHQEEPHPSV